MYDKYTARPFGRLFLVLHPNIAVLLVSIKGKGSNLALFRVILRQSLLDLARHMIECFFGVPANIAAGDFAG